MLINACKAVGLSNIGKSKYLEIERHRDMITNKHIKIGNHSYEKAKNILAT